MFVLGSILLLSSSGRKLYASVGLDQSVRYVLFLLVVSEPDRISVVGCKR